MLNIKNIIFDLGGVVIRLNRNRAADSLAALGIADAPALLGEYQQKGPFLKLETGEFSSADFYDFMIPLCRKDVTCADIRDAFEQFLIDIPVENLEIIRALRKSGFRLFVLSNTNPIMFNHWIAREFKKEGLSINDYFDGIVVSFQEGICKPDPEIFNNLIHRYGLNPAYTLMLDDSEANCLSAESVGLKAIRVTPEGENSILDICNRLIQEGPAK